MSHIQHYRRAVCALVATACFISVPVVARAQAASLATVALVRELPDSTARATIIRTAAQTLVLLRERDADAATLASAMVSLYRSREHPVQSRDKKLVINLHGQRPLASLRPEERKVADQQLARLRSARVATIDGLGAARVTTVALEARKSSPR